MRKKVGLALVVMLAGAVPSLYSQDQKAEIQKKLASQFAKTKFAADMSDVVTAGSVLVLHKDGLMMCSTEARTAPQVTYKNGSLSFGFGASMAWTMALSTANQQPNNIAQRKFVAGEKFWVTDYSVRDDGVYFLFFSDPFDDVRYHTQLKVFFPKGKFPSTDEVMKTIAEVITVDNPPPDNPPADTQPPNQPVAAPESAAPPKTIAVGQTIDEVVAILGQPQKIVDLGKKEMYFYPDMKVIFVDGKVSDVQ
ncbi:MAG: hypothetical protein ACRD59_18265 [Candidatus Acidiferrales bacterium]